MPAIVKNELRLSALDAVSNRIKELPTYFFVSGLTPWGETGPGTPIDNQVDEIKTLSDTFGLKRIQANDLITVLPRVTWTEGTVYDHYSQDVDLINDRNPDTGDFYRFYVVTEDFNVYKCLGNAYGAASETRPTGTSPEAFRTPDGYIWKYMYTIQATDAFKFMTSNWMPCYTLTFNDGSPQWNSQISAIPGTLDNIIVTNKGSGYNFVSPPTIQIVGDGSNATASAVVNEITGELDDIVVTNPGNGYTSATIQIIDENNGLGAEAIATIGPRKGHGHDPRLELGAVYLMAKVTIDGDESGLFPDNISFRTSGIIQLPGSIEPEGFVMRVTNAKPFSSSDQITGSVSNATANIKLIDYDNNLLYINGVVGQFLEVDVISNGTNQTGISTIYNSTDPLVGVVYAGDAFDKQTGDVLYIANREKITRTNNQREDIIAILSF